MTLMVLFAVLAGAGTALTPCVLPVLPALLSAGAAGGRRRPLGIVLGLVLTHTIAIVALAEVIDGVGLADGTVRAVAIGVLIVFGAATLWPALGDRVERPLARLARLGPKGAGEGFWTGLAVGGALGFLYAPCAGPILAAVVSVGATQGTSTEIVAVALGYGAGSGAVLLLMSHGGRRAVERLRRLGRGARLQRALGVVMVLTAALMAAELDVRFQAAIAGELPAMLVNPTRSLERSAAVEDRLAELRGSPRFDSGAARAAPRRGAAGLRDLGPAPGFRHNEHWWGGGPLRLRDLRGRVVLVDFWTYTCINCLRTLPYVKAWDARYRRKGLTVVGVHTPEFPFEREAANVARAIDRSGLRYRVAQDNSYATWTAWGNQYWPAKYLVDARGRVRYTHFGEGGYRDTEEAIRALLKEARAIRLGRFARARAEAADPGVETPETYLGSARARAFEPRMPANGEHRYRAPRDLPASHFALGGVWRTAPQFSTAVRGASLHARFVAKKVFVVLSSKGGHARRVRVLLDGKPAGRGVAGEDVENGVATVAGERLYRLISLPRAGEHSLSLRFERGLTGYAVTFG